jgi:hypothetical protein
MADETYLYAELLRAIHKKASEVLCDEEELHLHHEIFFSAESLLSSMDPDLRKYEQTIRMLLAKMVHEGILEGSAIQYHTTRKFEKEYEAKSGTHL